MPDSTRLDQFRLALSYLERIEGETAHWDKLRADQQLDRTKYDTVRSRYAEHLSRAGSAVDRMRRDAQKEIPTAEALLADAQRDQKRLIKRATAGKGDPKELNEQNRALSTRLADLNEQLDSLRSIVDAKSTGQLGGGINLPLEEYPVRLDLLPRPPSLGRRGLTPLQSNLLWGAIMLLLVLGAVGGIYLWRSAPHPEFAISTEDLRMGFAVVECRNEGNRPLFLYVPWPNGRAVPLPGVSTASNSWGITLSVREMDQVQFRLYEDAGEIWKLRGSYVDNTGPISVRSGGVVRLALDLDRLRATGLEVEAIRIECTRSGGGAVLSRDIELPATE